MGCDVWRPTLGTGTKRSARNQRVRSDLDWIERVRETMIVELTIRRTYINASRDLASRLC